MSVKQAYFQGGGGVNQPEPKKKKYKSDPALVVQPRFKEPFFRNYDLYNTPGEHSPGAGWHDMEKYKSVQEFLKAKRKKRKDKYKPDDSWQQDDGKRTKKNPNVKARAAIFQEIIKTGADNNDIDFPIDEQVNHYNQMIYPGEEQYHKPRLMGPLGPAGGEDYSIIPGDVGPELFQSSFQAGQIAGEHSILPEHDFEGRSADALNFGRDYEEEHEPARGLHEDILQKLFNKYLGSSESGLFGLPDGVDPEGHDADQTEQVEEPFTGTSDIGTGIYKDRWNI